MMYKINCIYCGEEFVFESLSERPETCPNCLSSLKGINALKNFARGESQSDFQKDVEKDSPAGLTLIYQTTNEAIHLRHRDKIVLGRKNVGAEVFGKIQQISRRHCVIEFIDNQYRITDLNSSNGTYLGISKIDCKTNPQQPLNYSDLLFLGREPFLVKKYSEDTDVQEKENAPVDEKKVCSDAELVKKRIVSYKCLGCGREYDRKRDICEECGMYGQWEEIERDRQD